MLTIVECIRVVIHWVQSSIVPICLVSAWMLVIMMGWSVWSAVRAGIANAQQMHQIPCTECRFYTGDYRLKCPVHPTRALSEQAIHCPDYEMKGLGYKV